ncbi:DUF2381 family protein [Corallococcus sp. AB032C]|uniref:DUF2381 family protein n=1 Tax=Corallococcus TaxID=83461 RepID=UPI000ED71D49|nr:MULTISPECIES: DUF2381 family protein [Corallococcus]NPC48374.1 DUF2381 family protein [Corallococcus exiguus]RKH80801.1 DUF2381 family protein [Corallococcus sp. AB032C]
MLLLIGGEVLAQPELEDGVQTTRRIELAETSHSIPEVLISAGLSSVLLFDSELAREGVELEGREHFSLLEIGQTVIRLIPSQSQHVGERVRLTVRFRDGAAPRQASFFLKVHPVRAEAIVEVYRQKRTLETYQQELREARAVALRCQSENARLLAERDIPSGLAGLLAAGVMERKGVAGRDLRVTVRQGAESGFEVRSVFSYRSASRVAVEATIDVAEGRPPWTANGATLKNKLGGELKVLRVWQQGPIAPASRGRVIVEAEAPPDVADHVFSLRLWEEGPRGITLGNVSFP